MTWLLGEFYFAVIIVGVFIGNFVFICPSTDSILESVWEPAQPGL